MKEAFIIGCCIAWAAFAACTLSGCAIPLLLGVKEYPTEDGPIRFITGADIMVGLNGVDAVENKRGISPKELR